MSERPRNCPVYNECTITRVLQPFYSSIYFTYGLSNGDTCPLFAVPPLDDVTWTSDTESPSDEDREGLTWTSIIAGA
jgi:hypothetical protein